MFFFVLIQCSDGVTTAGGPHPAHEAMLSHPRPKHTHSHMYYAEWLYCCLFAYIEAMFFVLIQCSDAITKAGGPHPAHEVMLSNSLKVLLARNNAASVTLSSTSWSVWWSHDVNCIWPSRRSWLVTTDPKWMQWRISLLFLCKRVCCKWDVAWSGFWLSKALTW